MISHKYKSNLLFFSCLDQKIFPMKLSYEYNLSLIWTIIALRLMTRGNSALSSISKHTQLLHLNIPDNCLPAGPFADANWFSSCSQFLSTKFWWIWYCPNLSVFLYRVHFYIQVSQKCNIGSDYNAVSHIFEEAIWVWLWLINLLFSVKQEKLVLYLKNGKHLKL